MLAPVLGEWILALGSWRLIFAVYVVLSLLVGFWLLLRQPETLAIADRAAFSVHGTFVVALRILSNSKVVAYTLSAGLLFGAQLSYYGLAQSIFTITYDQAENFTTFFALLALAVGVASLVNAKLVLLLGTVYLVRRALVGMVASSGAMFALAILTSGIPLWVFLVLSASFFFFCMGILFGNIGAMAMDMLGAVAGIGASIIASVSSLVAVFVSEALGTFHDTTLLPLSYLFCGSCYRHIRACGDCYTA